MIKDFYRPQTIDEAQKLKKEGVFFLGGGTKLNHGGEEFGAEAFISLTDLDLKGIEIEGDRLVMGASETLQNLADSDLVPAFLKEAVLAETNRNIRNASTIAGRAAACRSYDTVAGALLAAGAVLKTPAGEISLDEYMGGKDDLILAVILPGKRIVAQKNQRRSANARPEITVSASVLKEGDAVKDALLYVGGVEVKPLRLTAVEKALVAGQLKNADAVQDAVMEALVPSTKEREHGTYLNYISGVMAADTVGRAMKG